MAWIAPKVNWTAETFINYNDINRIVDNLKYLKGLASHLYTTKIKDVNVAQKYSFWQSGYTELYADEVNNIENALTSLNAGTLNYDIGKQKTYRDNGAYIDYVELNRIEKAMYSLYMEMTFQTNNLDRLAFTLGGERKFKI